MNIDPNTALTAATEGAKAATKLQEIIQKWFNPHWTRKQDQADAEADERRIKMIRDNPDMEIVFVEGKMSVRQRTPEELAKRAEQRLLAESIRQQDNIESVLAVAEDELHQTEDASDTPVDDDWIARFFSIIKDISNEEMQYIWGKILANEIKSPKSVSLRTMDILKNISSSEANIFQQILPYVINNGDDLSFVSANKDIKDQFNILDGHYIQLDSCGLLQMIPFTEISISLSPNETQRTFLTNNRLLSITNNTSSEQNLNIQEIYLLTSAGKELFNLLVSEPNDAYFEEWVRLTHKSNKKLIFTVHEKAENKKKEYKANPLISFGE